MGTDSSSEQSKRHGFSLVESAIVLAVVGLVIGGIWVASSAMQEKNRQDKTLEMLTLCVDKMRRILKSVPAYSYADEMIIDDLAISIGAIPESKQTAYGTISIRYEWGIGDQEDGKNFRVSLYNLSKSGCISITSFFSNIAANYGLTRIVFFYPQGSHTNYITFPIAMNYIENECSNETYVDLQFSY